MVFYPLLTFTTLLFAWQYLVRAFGVPEYILPVPSEFLAKFVESRALIWRHTLVTAKEILLGFSIATVIAVPLGFLIVSIRVFERAFYPLIVFFQKKVDAILGGSNFQSVQIRDRGFQVTEILYRDIGVPTVGLSIIARDDKLKADPDLYRRFVAASLKGWDETRRNPEAAAAAVAEQYPSANREQVLKQLRVALKSLCVAGASSLGRVPEKNWERTYELLTGYLGLPKTLPVTEYYTNAFLPADPPACPR